MNTKRRATTECGGGDHAIAAARTMLGIDDNDGRGPRESGKGNGQGGTGRRERKEQEGKEAVMGE